MYPTFYLYHCAHVKHAIIFLCRITSLQSEHSSAINGVMTAMKMENEQKLTTTVEAVKRDEKEQFQKELNDLKQCMEVDKAQAVEEERQKTFGVQEQLKMLREVS